MWKLKRPSNHAIQFEKGPDKNPWKEPKVRRRFCTPQPASQCSVKLAYSWASDKANESLLSTTASYFRGGTIAKNLLT